MPVYLVGNKFDLVRNDPSARAIKYDEAFEFAQLNFIEVVAECSAKDGTNVKVIFEQFFKGFSLKRRLRPSKTTTEETNRGKKSNTVYEEESEQMLLVNKFAYFALPSLLL